MSPTEPATAVLSARAADVFRGLWASVFYTGAASPKSVLVCSPNHGEGATTIACGLALAGAGEPGRARVALVDFNLRTPNVDRRLRLANGAGVSEVLVGAAALDEALQRVGPGRLDVLTAGEQARRLVEVLRTDGVRRLVGDLEERYDRVVVDAAPVNPYPDAQVVARAVGGVVLVARCRRTPRESLLAAKRRLTAAPRAAEKLLGAVLNMRTFPVPKFLYRRI
jgi:capsular exopolysaccharide synthesis family protein